VTATSAVKLSVLDQSASVAGGSDGAAIRDTLTLAAHCEALGYHRFWVSEHHGLPTIVGSAPEVLMGAIAARTTRIRIGSAGVMLPHYSALKVAEQFRVLDALAPGRIDLGVGRAPGGDQRSAQALNPGGMRSADDFPQQVHDLMAWTTRAQHRGIVARPLGSTAPSVWILGSSDYGAQLAGQFGLPYAFAYFFADGDGAEQALRLYRDQFTPGPQGDVAQATLCVWALAADTQEEAEHLALSRERWRVDRQRGVFGPLQATDVIAARGFTRDEMPTVQAMRDRAFVGSASHVAAQLRALAAAFELDELVINTWTHDPAATRHSHALLAAEFGLAGLAARPDETVPA